MLLVYSSGGVFVLLLLMYVGLNLGGYFKNVYRRRPEADNPYEQQLWFCSIALCVSFIAFIATLFLMGI